MRWPMQKSLCLALVFVYSTTQVVLGSVAESNLWAERRKHAELHLRLHFIVLRAASGLAGEEDTEIMALFHGLEFFWICSFTVIAAAAINGSVGPVFEV